MNSEAISGRNVRFRARGPAVRRGRSLLPGLVLAFLLLLAPLHALAARPSRLHEALVDAVAATVLRSVEISLQEGGQPDLAAWTRGQSPPARLRGGTLAELAESFGARLTADLVTQGRGADVPALRRALARSTAYLGLDGRPLEEPLALPPTSAAATSPVSLTHEVEDLTSAVCEASWPGIDAYAEDRLGPLREILSTLGPRDRVVLTNLRRPAALGLLPPMRSATLVTLPLSSYGKGMVLAVEATGRRSLLLFDVDSRSYLVHVGLLVSRFRHAHGLQFAIAEHVDAPTLERSYGQLASFAAGHAGLFSSLDTLVVGYTWDFRRAWEPYLVGEAHQEGHAREAWDLWVYRFPEGNTVGVLGGDVDYYGEGLAEQLERLHRRFPFKRVLFGGSGGAVIPRPPYDLYVPSVIRSPDGCETRNVLTASADAGSHVSVDSPLLETPTCLAAFQRLGQVTVDMEGGHLARLALRHGVEVGVGVVVTDFPVGFASIGASLAEQAFGAKTRSRGQFVRLVEGYVRTGRRTWLHALEEATDTSLVELSRRTLQAHREEVGSLTREEQEVLERLFSLPFHVTVRMSPGRLHWMLRDGALFSTGLVRSLGGATDPYTPQLEDDMFGAFDYVFAEYSTLFGRSRYGDAAVVLRRDEILPRCWGSRASGWRVAGYEPGATLDTHRRNFLKEVLHPDHFRQAMALQAVYRWRKLSAAERAKLLALPASSWPPLLYELGFGKLELKIKSYVLLRDVERVLLPPHVQGDLPRMLRERAVPYERCVPDRLSAR